MKASAIRLLIESERLRAGRSTTSGRSKISGAVDDPVSWTWEELFALPAETPTVDVHCVTAGRSSTRTWRGVSVDTLLDGAETEADDELPPPERVEPFAFLEDTHLPPRISSSSRPRLPSPASGPPGVPMGLRTHRARLACPYGGRPTTMERDRCATDPRNASRRLRGTVDFPRIEFSP